jgi:peptidoglycan hydrolase-like protein with peptidoglycan-binding domain
MTVSSTIYGSVGEKGKNVRDDVLVVQNILMAKGFNPGPIDGVCGLKTVSAIRDFQRTFLASPDGLVEPGRATWKKLKLRQTANSALGGQWTGDSALWAQDKNQ